MKRAALLDQVKQTIHEIEPEADIILYGSRARGDAHPESDWDFLILLAGVAPRHCCRHITPLPGLHAPHHWHADCPLHGP